MREKNIKERIISVLASNYIFINYDEEDVDLLLYIEDSIQFISFVVALEQEFNIEFSNELMAFDRFRYLNDICVLIEEINKNKTE